MAGTLAELWKKGTSEPLAEDIPEGGIAIDVAGEKMYSKSNNGDIFEIGGGAPVDHEHVIDDVTGLQDALDAKENDLLLPSTNGMLLSSTTGGFRSWVSPPSGVTDHKLLSNIGNNDHDQIDAHLAISSGNPHNVIWSEIPGKPATFPPESHGHPMGEITGLNDALDDKSDLGHDHEWDEINSKPIAFPPEQHEHNADYFQKIEHIEETTGPAEAFSPVQTNANGKLSTSFMEMEGFQYQSAWNPSVVEYPTITDEPFGAFWVVDGVDADLGYTFIEAGGDLEGQTVHNGSLMIWGSLGWSSITAQLDPNLYYKLDGSVAINAPFAGGGQRYTSMGDGSANDDGVNLGQLNSGLNTKSDTGHQHSIDDVTGLQPALNLKLEQADLDSALTIGLY